MRTMTKERKKEGPRLGHKGRADAKASRQLLLLCIPAIIAYILFNYIPMGAAVIIPFKNYKFSKGCLLYTSPSPRDGLLSRMPSSA